MNTRTFLIASACVLAAARLSSAQDPEDPFASAKMHVGPFAVTPSLAVTNLGVDTNVFNEWTNPRSDWTATITPQADVWLRLGRARVSAKTAGSFVYFATYHEERSLNTNDSVRLDLPLNKIRPYVGLTYLNTRDRPGFEIDTRARRTETGFNGGIDFPYSKKTTFGIGFKRNDTSFPSGETFQGTYLRDVFNRTTQGFNASVRYAITPLTTFVLALETQQEKFEFSPIRDSSSIRIVPGVELKPFALISGSAHVGVRKLTMDAPSMPDYTGVVAAVNLGYTLLGATRFAVQVDRDVAYSYDVNEPYYLLTGYGASITQHVGGPWDVVGRAGIQRLAYQRATAANPGSGTESGRVDRVRSLGGGFGYKLGPTVRLGFNVDYYTRVSDRVTREYRGLRAGTSVTYGF